MNAEYFSDEIISILNEGLDTDELRIRITKVINRIFEQERTKHLAKGITEYKRIDAENPVRELPKRDGTDERNKPIIATLTNEGRFINEQTIEEL